MTRSRGGLSTAWKCGPLVRFRRCCLRERDGRIPHAVLTPPRHFSPQPTGLTGTLFNLLESEVGGGVLSLPYGFAAGGLLSR